MKLIKRENNNSNEFLPITNNDPVRALRSMHEAMDRLFNDQFLTPFTGFRSLSELPMFSPKVDISETKNEIKARIEVPGIDPKDVNIEVSDDSPHISGKLDKTEEEKQENYYRMERAYGQFSREFALPSKVDTDSVKAEAKNGVITVTIKKADSEQKKKVEVETV